MARLLVSGPRALFRRPEFSNAAISYDVITPWAARRIFEAVHWTPSIWWVIERIEVLTPIKIERPRTSADGTVSTYLVDVKYAVTARFEMTSASGSDETPAQHAAMFKRRAQRRHFTRAPFLGQRGLAAQVDYINSDESLPSFYLGKGEHDLGWMIYDRDAGDRDAVYFFRPTMIDGVIDLTAIDPASMAR